MELNPDASTTTTTESDDTPVVNPIPTPEPGSKVAQAREPLRKANGVSEPAAGALTRKVWDTANAISAAAQRPALRDEVMTKLLAEGMNKGTIATQYGKWCTFYGVDAKSRGEARADTKTAKAAADKADSDAAKAAAAPAPAPTSEVPAETPAA